MFDGLDGLEENTKHAILKIYQSWENYGLFLKDIFNSILTVDEALEHLRKSKNEVKKVEDAIIKCEEYLSALVESIGGTYDSEKSAFKNRLLTNVWESRENFLEALSKNGYGSKRLRDITNDKTPYIV